MGGLAKFLHMVMRRPMKSIIHRWFVHAYSQYFPVMPQMDPNGLQKPSTLKLSMFRDLLQGNQKNPHF